MRLTLPGLALLLLAAAAAAEPGFVERFKAATAAYEAKDYARMEAELRAALALRPAHPTATYNLASALALRGQSGAAVETLNDLANMGLVFDPGADHDFTALKGQRDYAAVRRAFARNDEPRGQAGRAFRLRSPTFIAEGIAWDPGSGHFYVGSVHERRIQRVLRDDTEVDFAASDSGLWSVLGMTVDAKRDLLWVATSALPEMRGAKADELGRAAIVAYKLKSGERRFRAVLDTPGPHALGDVAVARDGTVYTSDSRGGMLYALEPETGKFKALTPAGALASPQGLALSRDGDHLYVADWVQGLFRYTVEGGKLERLEVADDISVYGIDGLYRWRDELIAIQNGIRPHRVVRLTLGDRGKRVRRAHVLAANLKGFEEPTLGVVAKDDFYFVANSQWNRFDKEHRLPPADRLNRPLVMRIRLGSEAAPQAPEEAVQPQPGLPLPCLPPLC